MREDLLHFIWKFKKFPLADLVTSKNEPVTISAVGEHNHLSGPDFFNAKISIDKQLWAGNVEIHVNASDWYAHRHEIDVNYDSVILHVVWKDDVSVFRQDGSEIPTLVLQNYISPKLLSSYQQLLENKKKTFINCEKEISQTNDFVFDNWLERLYFERLEQKSNFIFELLKKSNNDWESVLFALLLKSFGLKINADSFLSLSNAIDFTLVRKLSNDLMQLESTFLGMTHLLDDDKILDTYYLKLKSEYHYLRNKWSLQDTGVYKPEFFKLRPPNFPTIRLSQLANLYSKEQSLFDKLIGLTNLDDIYDVFEVAASPYWSDHYTFGKQSRKSTKKLTKNFIQLLIINAVIPLKFCHAKQVGKDVNQEVVAIISQLKAETNVVVSNFKKHNIIAKHSKDSQAMLQLYNNYCTKNRCLECAVGSSLLLLNV